MAHFSPKGILMNSQRPNGMMITVLAMSAADIGICIYPRIKSTLEKIHFPARSVLKSRIVGMG